MDAIRIQSKFLVVSPTRILHPAQIVVRQGRVVELTQHTNQTPDIDLGETALIPGLVNPHTHLEFSSLRVPFSTGENFPSWIARVIAYRQSVAETTAGTATNSQPGTLTKGVHAGLRECFLSGTTLVGDIVTPPWKPSCLPSAQGFGAAVTEQPNDFEMVPPALNRSAWWEHFGPLSYPRVVAFAELLGLGAERFESSWRWASAMTEHDNSELLQFHALSPHAPYSVHFPTLERIASELSPTKLLAMHVAESPAELEWLNAGTGPFHAMYERLGIAVECPPPTPPPSIDQCIELLSRRERALLIHGNYLTPAQIESVAAAPGITVVYCPRTHAHFDHARYPLEEMLSAGLQVVLGTDSRASNPDLSLWDEVVHVRQQFPEIAPSKLFDWVTLGAARALGLEHDFGSLEPGRLAHACAIPAHANWNVRNLLEELGLHTTSELGMHPLICVIADKFNS